MKISFSTLACPAWNLDAVIEVASRIGFDGIELRFIENDDRLWQRPEFSGPGLRATRKKLSAAGLQVACLDTSCFFHYPEAGRRSEALEMGKAMIELAAELEAPGIRVFGDRIQPGADRAATASWIAENIQALAEFGRAAGVEIWLESHGDFACARETLDVLKRADQRNTGVVWDPLNAFSEFDEHPKVGFATLGAAIRHVHIKDARPRSGEKNGDWELVLLGEGTFPARGVIRCLADSGYERFISLEWEKRWHPEIAEPEVALPHFMKWIRAELEA